MISTLIQYLILYAFNFNFKMKHIRLILSYYINVTILLFVLALISLLVMLLIGVINYLSFRHL